MSNLDSFVDVYVNRRVLLQPGP